MAKKPKAPKKEKFVLPDVPVEVGQYYLCKHANKTEKNGDLVVAVVVELTMKAVQPGGPLLPHVVLRKPLSKVDKDTATHTKELSVLKQKNFLAPEYIAERIMARREAAFIEAQAVPKSTYAEWQEHARTVAREECVRIWKCMSKGEPTGYEQFAPVF